MFPFHCATEVGGMIHHPELRNNFADQFSVTKNAYYRAFRNHNSHSFGNCTHISSGNMTATESQRRVHLCGHGIEIAARGKENSLETYHKPAVQLCQFLDGSAEIEIGDM